MWRHVPWAILGIGIGVLVIELGIHSRGAPWIAVVPLAAWAIFLAVVVRIASRGRPGSPRPRWRRPGPDYLASSFAVVVLPLLLLALALDEGSRGVDLGVPPDAAGPRDAGSLANIGWTDGVDLLEAAAVGGGAWLAFFAPYYAWARTLAPAVKARLLRGRLRELAGYVPRRGTLWAWAAMGILLVPVSEEVLYRGVLVRMAGQWTGMTGICAAASLVLFVAAHANQGGRALWQHAPFAAVATLLVLSPWGLPAAVAFHACNNIAAFGTLPGVPGHLRRARAAVARGAGPIVR
jgi:membrane protease YdiL (CAAX protease family)